VYWISYEIGANLFKKGDKDAGIAQFAFATDIPEARELIMKAAKEYLFPYFITFSNRRLSRMNCSRSSGVSETSDTSAIITPLSLE
jgi:hypothetical protein